MKNEVNEKFFAAAVAKQVEKAVALGLKASWGTEKHLSTLAELLESKGSAEERKAALLDAYNVSAYCQMLEGKFEKFGHFQREKKRGVVKQADDLFDSLLAGLAGSAGSTEGEK